jgi:hypothetical protein
MRDRVVDSTVRISFNTNDGDGAPVAPSSAFEVADFQIYKDGSATQKTSANGITVTSPFDSLVGLHLIEIDTSNDTDDAGFWSLNSEYRVAINSAKTVDGVSQSGVIVGEFRLVSGTSAGAGTGARTVTITVTDGTTALQNAVVRLTEGVNTFRALTNASGVAVFNLDDASYTVAVTKSGYTYSGTTLVVDGTETATYSMTVISITPPDDPALCAVTFHLRDQYGTDLANQPVEITWVQWDDAATETPPVLSVPPVQETDADGEVSVNLYRNAQYKIVYGKGRDARRWDGTIPDAGSYEVDL